MFSFLRQQWSGHRRSRPAVRRHSFRPRVLQFERREVPSVTINSFTPPSGAVEGASTGGALAIFSGTAPSINAYTATTLWGDGSTSILTAANGGITANTDGTFTVSATYTYGEEGSYPFSVTVDAGIYGNASQGATVVVSDAALSAYSMNNLTGTPNVPLGTGPITLATFYDFNPNADINDFTGTVAWSDGTTDNVSSAAGGIVAVSGAPGQWNVLGNHTFASTGAYSATITVQDTGGSSTSVTVPVIVANASPLAVTPYDPTTSVNTLTNALIVPGTGLTLTGTTYVGQGQSPTDPSATPQAGTYTGFSFSDGTHSLALPDGILLTSGSALNAVGPNTIPDATTYWNTPGDPDLDQMVIPPDVTYDANALTLTFTADPKVTTIQFKFVFGSEEFPEWVGQYNDIFAAYLDGKQISLDPVGNPISVNNNYFLLNNSGDTTNPATNGKTVVAYDIQYDGLTPVLTTQAALDTTKTEHTLKFVIADTRDQVLDSGVFISSLSGNSSGGTGTGEAPEANAGGPYSVAPGGSVVLDASKTTDEDQDPSTLIYKWDLNGNGIYGETGTAATNGDEVGIHPTFVANGLAAGTEKIVSLMVTDNTGLKSTAQADIVVTGATLGLSGFPTTTAAGASHSFTVTVYNPDGTVDTGYTGTVHVTSSDGQALLPADYKFTAKDNGRHTFYATLKTAGPQSLTVSDQSDPTIYSTQSGITVTPAAAAQLVLSGLPTSTVAGVSQTFTVTVQDAFGNLVPTYTGTVKFTSTDLKAVKPANHTFTASDQGVHTFTVTFETAGARSITAIDTVTSKTKGSESTVVTPAPAAVLTVAGFTSPTIAGDLHTFIVTARDAYGNTATGYTGTIHFTSTDTHAVLPANYTFTPDNAGTQSFSAVLKTAGARTLTATDTVTKTITGKETIIVQAAAAIKFKLTAPTTATAGTPFSMTVTALDAYGNVATGYLGMVHFTSTDTQAMLPADYTFSATDKGKHTFTSGVILKTAGTKKVTVTDLGAGAFSASVSLKVNPATAAQFVVAGFPTTATHGVAYSFTITAYDAYGNVATGYHGKVHFTSSDPAALLPADYTLALGDQGRHTFTATLDTLGVQWIQVNDVLNTAIWGKEDGITVV